MVFFADIGVPQRTRGSATASLGCDFVFTNWECDPSCLSAYEMPSIRMAFQRVEKVFSPRCLSSFLNFPSSENCLIERERGFLPLSLFPRYSVAELHFIVFDSLKRPFESGQPPRRGYSVTTSTTVSVSPSIVKRTSSPSKLKP